MKSAWISHGAAAAAAARPSQACRNLNRYRKTVTKTSIQHGAVTLTSARCSDSLRRDCQRLTVRLSLRPDTASLACNSESLACPGNWLRRARPGWPVVTLIVTRNLKDMNTVDSGTVLPRPVAAATGSASLARCGHRDRARPGAAQALGLGLNAGTADTKVHWHASRR